MFTHGCRSMMLIRLQGLARKRYATSRLGLRVSAPNGAMIYGRRDRKLISACCAKQTCLSIVPNQRVLISAESWRAGIWPRWLAGHFLPIVLMFVHSRRKTWPQPVG